MQKEYWPHTIFLSLYAIYVVYCLFKLQSLRFKISLHYSNLINWFRSFVTFLNFIQGQQFLSFVWLVVRGSIQREALRYHKTRKVLQVCVYLLYLFSITFWYCSFHSPMYCLFHKPLPKSSLQMHWISVRFYEIVDIIPFVQGTLVSWTKEKRNIYKISF